MEVTGASPDDATMRHLFANTCEKLGEYFNIIVASQASDFNHHAPMMSTYDPEKADVGLLEVHASELRTDNREMLRKSNRVSHTSSFVPPTACMGKADILAVPKNTKKRRLSFAAVDMSIDNILAGPKNSGAAAVMVAPQLLPVAAEEDPHSRSRVMQYLEDESSHFDLFSSARGKLLSKEEDAATRNNEGNFHSRIIT